MPRFANDFGQVRCDRAGAKACKLPASREVTWTDRALADLTNIAAHIAADDPVAAVRWTDTLVDATEPLAATPQMGRQVPEFGRKDLRELIVRNYRIVYRLTADHIEIVTVFEGHRLMRGPG